MALIKCPECGKEISDRADACIHCGCPLKNIMNEIKIQVSSCGFPILSKKSYVMFSCKEVLKYPSNAFEDGEYVRLLDKNNYLVKEVKIEKFSSPLDINTNKLCFNFVINDLTKNEANSVVYICKALIVKEEINEINESVNEYNKTLVKCPTCSSTDVTRISASEKVANIALFGLFGNKRKMQFQCNNCKYMW